MATATTPLKPFNRVETDQRVRHPLYAIRGYIRRYVLTEGIALAVLFVAVCFWLGLAFDFSLWVALSFDWLYSFNEVAGSTASVVLRSAFLLLAVGGLVGLVAFKIFRRLFKEFSDSAVAMLLERRYPRQLGERLITAVELADPKLAEKYGYSQPMVDATIREAAQRVEKLPVHEIFRWGRLKFVVALAILATVGMYLLVGAVWCAANLSSPVEFAVRFHQTASIWAERNLLMMNSYWPPDTLIELIRFPGQELSVPREEDRPDVKVRYIRWAIADSGDEVPRGWRALRFDDLENLLPKEMLDIQLPVTWGSWIVDLDDLDPKVPAGAIPREWGWQGATTGLVRHELRNDEIKQVLDRGDKEAQTRNALIAMFDWRNWTVDKIEQQLQFTADKSRRTAVKSGPGALPVEAEYVEHPVAAGMNAEYPADYAKFLAILAKLEELAEEPAMGRTLRKMDEPSKVIAVRKNKSGSGGNTNCTAVEGQRKFLFQLSELKESCQFSISSGDYWTPWRQITLVPPPIIDQMRIDKDEPAYLWYRMLENPALLKLKRQKISSTSISTTGPFSKLLVPAGTDVTVIAHSDRPLSDVRVAEPDIKKREEKTSITVPEMVDLSKDKQTLVCTFKDVRRIVEFDFEFKDKDGVKGSRRVIIVPLEDQAPRIGDLGLGVLPRLLETTDDGARGIAAGPRWVITPDAYLKLKGKIEDDHGLTKMEYKYDLLEVDFQNLFGDQPENKPAEPSSPDVKETKKPSRGEWPEAVLAGFQMAPDSTTYGIFAAAYYGTLHQVALPPPPPRTGFVPLGRGQAVLDKKYGWDVTPEELDRLLKIQPAYRVMLLEALALTPEKRTLAKFVDALKEANQTEGFLREVMDFAGLAGGGNERINLQAAAAGDPAAALAQILQRFHADKDKLKVDKDLLEKQPETTITKTYNLQNEDSVFGFDVGERLRYIKALKGVETQKHYALRVSIVATDNNVNTGPGVTMAALQFSFLIVSENELLALMMRDQRRYYDLLDGAVKEMEKTRQHLEGQLIDYRKNPEEPTKLLVRADAVRKALRDGGNTARSVLLKYEGLLKEMEFNRMDPDRIAKVRTKVAEPLTSLTSAQGGFPKTEQQANQFYKELSPDADKKDKADMMQRGDDPAVIKDLMLRKDDHLKNGDQTHTQLSDLIRDLNKVLDAMQDVVTDDRAWEEAVYIEAMHRKIHQVIQVYQVQFQQRLREELIKGSGGDGK